MMRIKKRSKEKMMHKELIKELAGKVAVYIDAANIEKSVQELGLFLPKHITKSMRWKADKDLWHVDYKKLHHFFKKNATLVSISFYTARFGTKQHNNF